MPVPVAATTESIARAAELLREGLLVAFPTETVYGLGARALDEHALARIYAAKNRPRSSPLIAHVASVAQARQLLSDWPDDAQRLTDAFWPGPLTLVLPKAAHVPDGLTAGLGWLGVRQPAHPVALGLIEATGEALAAPSANPFMHLSPTTAEHVSAGFDDAVAMILDGGACRHGIESTVVRLGQGEPELLRLGAIPRALIERVLGHPLRDARPPENSAHASPGQHRRHYAPRTPLLVWQPGQALPPGRGVLLGATEVTQTPTERVAMPADAEAYGSQLYAKLHALDARGFEWIAVQAPPALPDWAAVNDRLQRAAESP